MALNGVQQMMKMFGLDPAVIEQQVESFRANIVAELSAFETRSNEAAEKRTERVMFHIDMRCDRIEAAIRAESAEVQPAGEGAATQVPELVTEAANTFESAYSTGISNLNFPDHRTGDNKVRIFEEG